MRTENKTFEDFTSRINDMIKEIRAQIAALQWLLADDHKHGDDTYGVWTDTRIKDLHAYLEYLENCKTYGEEPMTFREFMARRGHMAIRQENPDIITLLEIDIANLKDHMRFLMSLIPGETTSMSEEELWAEIHRIYEIIQALIKKLNAINSSAEKQDPSIDYIRERDIEEELAHERRLEEDERQRRLEENARRYNQIVEEFRRQDAEYAAKKKKAEKEKELQRTYDGACM